MSGELRQWTTGDGRTVTTIGSLRETVFNGTRCYAVLTTGDHDAYLARGNAQVLHWHDMGDGVRETYYVPDGDFAGYAARLDHLNAWGRS